MGFTDPVLKLVKSNSIRWASDTHRQQEVRERPVGLGDYWQRISPSCSVKILAWLGEALHAPVLALGPSKPMGCNNSRN